MGSFTQVPVTHQRRAGIDDGPVQGRGDSPPAMARTHERGVDDEAPSRHVALVASRAVGDRSTFQYGVVGDATVLDGAPDDAERTVAMYRLRFVCTCTMTGLQAEYPAIACMRQAQATAFMIGSGDSSASGPPQSSATLSARSCASHGSM